MMKGASSPLPLLKGGRGFTLIELLITCAVMAIIAALAIPTYMSYAGRASQQDARAQLTAIWQAEELYKLQYGTYTANTTGLSGWMATLNKYTFSITAADTTTFSARASGNLDNDATSDVWTIIQDGTLTNTPNDVNG